MSSQYTAKIKINKTNITWKIKSNVSVRIHTHTHTQLPEDVGTITSFTLHPRNLRPREGRHFPKVRQPASVGI